MLDVAIERVHKAESNKTKMLALRHHGLRGTALRARSGRDNRYSYANNLPSTYAQQQRFIHCAVLKEKAGERRVTMTPDIAKKFIKDGYSFNIEKGAGVEAGFSDAAYTE